MRLLHRPIAGDIGNLEGFEPGYPGANRQRYYFPASFHQRVRGERRVPHRRDAGLAVSLVLVDNEQLVDRTHHLDHLGVLPSVAQRIEHHRRIRHCGVDRAEPILAVQSLFDECNCLINRPLAQAFREIRLRPAQNLVQRAKQRRPRKFLLRRAGPMANPVRRFDEEFINGDIARISRPRFQRIHNHQRNEKGAAPVGDFGHVERKPARQQQNLDRHDRHAAPRQRAEERQQGARENIDVRRPAMREDRRAGAPHMIRLRAIANRLQCKIGLDAAADVERAIGEKRPAAVRRLLAPNIRRDLGFEPSTDRFAEKMLKKNIFRRDRNIGFQLEDEMPIRSLHGHQRLRRPGNRRLDLRKLSDFGELRVRGSTLGDAVHIIHPGRPFLQRSYCDATIRPAARWPDRIAPSIVAGRPVAVQSPASTRLA
ncbi:MAG: hypothetical protein USCAAHI_00918 [Beijerinckiaceae bacterium]|nr:MAG: hypothetical protein USCAAHI_00918 [Beijerinckiaceae bacterium]